MAVPPTPTPSAITIPSASATPAANNLLIEQLLNGTNNKITVNTLSIAAINPIGLHDGLTTSQGNGNGDITTITGVTTLNNAPLPICLSLLSMPRPTSSSVRAAGPVIPPA